MKKNENGFSAVEVILVLIVVGLLGAVGWLVYDKQNNKKTDSKTSETQFKPSDSQSNTDVMATDSTKDWLLYTSQNKKYTVSVPDGWHLYSLKGSDDIYAWNMSDIPYKTGTKAMVDTVEGGRDGKSIAFSLHYSATDEDSAYNLNLLTKIKEYTSANKLDVIKYSRTQKTEPEGMDIPLDAVQYFYDINKKGPRIQITHDELSGEFEQTQNIEKMIDSLKLL